MMTFARKGFGFTVAALSLGILGTTAAPREAAADGIRIQSTQPLMLLATPVALQCSNPGSHQDVSKTPSLTNNTGAAIPKGHVISWKASDGDHGSIKLESDLAPGASLTVMGQPNNGYSCSASFLSNADLTIKTAAFASASSATFQIENLDPWVATAPQVVRLEVVSCSGAQVLAKVETAPFAVGKGETKSMTVTFPAVSGKNYLRINADVTGQVIEKDEKNNHWDSMGRCI
jgi:hypothetical protein